VGKRISVIARIAVLVTLVSLVAFPAGGAPGGNQGLSPRLLSRLSSGFVTKYWIAHPEQAPPAIRSRLETAVRQAARAQAASGSAAASGLFNFDDFGLPQNEESVDVCHSNPKYVIGGTNDYRYVLDPEGNSTGWHLSTNGGASLKAEGLLPSIDLGGIPVPSGGDPVFRFDDTDCGVYGGDLNYTFGDAFPDNFPNGIGLYRSDVSTLKSCPSGGSDPSCWPTSIFAATAADNHHFLDKEWFDVGTSGGEDVVWVTWSDFLTPDLNNPDAFTASIWAARCDAALTTCTDPIDISGSDEDIQFSYVTIGPDGRVYVTWAEIQGELEGEPETFIVKLRVAEPGETTFGPTQIVETLTKPIGFDNTLYGHTFRVATVPKNAVKMVAGEPRVYVTWEECASRPLGYCQNPSVWVAWSDDQGASWDKKVVSAGGDNYFPTIAADSGKNIAVAYFTSRYDGAFQLAQDVELVTLNPSTLAVKNRQRLTSPSNNPNADWFFSGGVFIGDYFEVAAYGGTAYVHTNLNYRAVQYLGGPPGKAESQQDNYLFVREL
jgi:hypothetical protein